MARILFAEDLIVSISTEKWRSLAL